MEKRQLGKTDMQVTALGYGGAEIGFQDKEAELAGTLLNAALDAGLNMIDTAECYKESEILIGNAVSHRRKDYYLFTKCGHAWAESGLESWDLTLLERSIERSLNRLKTDYLDLIQLHSCSEEMLRKGEVIEVLQKAKIAGKVRYVGYSGDNQAARYAIECGAFDTLQTSVNLFDQSAIDENLPLAREKKMGIIVKRPIGNVVWLHAERPENDYVQVYWDRMKELNYPFATEGAATMAEAALRFTLSVPGVHTAIVGTSNPERWAQNAELVERGVLPDADYDAIRSCWKSVAKADWSGQV